MLAADLTLFISGQVKSKIKFSPGGERKSADKILAEVKSKIELRERENSPNIGCENSRTLSEMGKNPPDSLRR
jgi:hypothetical protein